MAGVPVVISGFYIDKYGRTGAPVTIAGMATIAGLGVGGGPMPPGEGGGGGDERPPGIWGGPIDPYPDHGLPGAPGVWPPPGRPTHPIVIPPGKPDVPPPSVWPGPGVPPEGTAPLPEHPIVLPKPEPIPPGTLITWTAVWTPEKGWMVVGVPNVPHPAPSA